MKRPILLSAIFFCIAQITFSQSFKFGKPTEEDLKYTTCDFEPEASAVILNEEGFMSISPDGGRLNVQRRIKILDDKGLEEANINIPYYHGESGTQRISNIKAVTINQEDGKITKHEVDKNEIYTVDLNEYWKEKRFTLSQVKPGSIIDYSYTIVTANRLSLVPWEFQHRLPTERSYYVIKNHGYGGYKILTQGNMLNENQQKNKNFQKIELKHIPSIGKYEHVYNVKDQVEKLSYQHESIGYSWKSIINEKLDYINRNKRSKALKEILAKIPNPGVNKSTLQKVLATIQKGYSWNGFKGQWVNQNLNELIKNKTGTSADINFLLYSTLQDIGFDTKLVLVSSREKGKIIVTVPYLDQFDYLGVLVNMPDEEVFFIDAIRTNPEALQYFPLNWSNYYAFVLDKEKSFIEINTPLSEYFFRHSYTIDDEKYKITQAEKWKGYFGDFNEKDESSIGPQLLLETSEDHIDLDKKFKDGNYLYNSTLVESLPDQRVVTLKNPLQPFLEKLYLKNDQRNIAIEYDFPFYVSGNIVFEIPEGYEVQNTANINLKYSDDILYSQLQTVKGNKLISKYIFLLGKNVIPAKDYQEFKKFLTEVTSTISQDVILRK